MTEKVWAVHKVTGIISEVLPSEIEQIPALVLATDKQIKAAHERAEIEVYGEVIRDGVIPEGPLGAPLEREETKVTIKDGADNG
jgi:hypothetical protein